MELNTQRRAKGLNEKVPEMQKSLETVQFLKTASVCIQFLVAAAACLFVLSRLLLCFTHDVCVFVHRSTIEMVCGREI